MVQVRILVGALVLTWDCCYDGAMTPEEFKVVLENRRKYVLECMTKIGALLEECLGNARTADDKAALLVTLRERAKWELDALDDDDDD